MAWQIDKYEHAKLWNSATHKVLTALDKDTLNFAIAVFQSEYSQILNDPSMKEDSARSMFIAWLIPSFHKNNKPVYEWYIKNYPENLTKEEKDVLIEGSKSRFDIFKIMDQTKEHVKLKNAKGEKFIAETIELPKLHKGAVIYARLNSKGNNKYFLSGKFCYLEDAKQYFNNLVKATKFRASWSSYLTGFVKYLVTEESLKERTADNHKNNVEAFMLYLEDTQICSFSDVSKTMLKTQFRSFANKHIMPKVDFDKVYYSLYKFFDYLAEEKKIHNDEAMNWLRNRIS